MILPATETLKPVCMLRQVVMEQGQVLDGALLLPAVSHTIDTQPGDTGLYLFQCDVQVRPILAPLFLTESPDPARVCVCCRTT